MKKLSFVFILSLLFTSLTVTAQYGYDDQFYGDNNTYPGYLGDNFSLEGALEIFKESRTLQDFENRLNRDEFFVNNLDLNNDGRTDFVRVQDVSEDRNYRLLALQAVLGRRDIQDVAVIAIEKTGRREATLQIVGDEYLFGPNMIVEPHDIAYNSDRNRGYGPSGADVEFRRLFVNVYYWPTVRSLFRSQYSFYRSPWSWGYYPDFYRPWRPWAYNYYYERCGFYRRPFWRVAPAVRIVYVNNYYFPRRRTYVPYVRNRYNDCVVYYNRDRRGDGPRRRNITQTVPDRRRDFDRSRGTKYQFRDRREGDTIGKRRNNNIARSERGNTAKGNRGTLGTGAPNRSVTKSSKTDRGITRSNARSTKPADSKSTKRSIDRSSKSNASTRPSQSTKSTRTTKSNDSFSNRSNRSSSKPSKSYSSKSKSSTRSSKSSSTPSRSYKNNSSSKSSRGNSSFKSSSSSKAKSSVSRSSSKSSKSSGSIKSSRSSNKSSARSSKKGF